MLDIHKQFDEAMMNIYHEAKRRCNYTASYYFNMLNDLRGLETAKTLMLKKDISEGFERLWSCGCLDLTVECLVLKPKYQKLFDEAELKIARRRLKAHGYDPTMCSEEDS